MRQRLTRQQVDHRAVSEREKALTAEVEELKLQLQSSAKVHDEEQAALRRKIEEQQETVRQAQMDLNQAVESRTSLFKSHAAAVSSKLRLEEQVKGTQQAFLKYQAAVQSGSQAAEQQVAQCKGVDGAHSQEVMSLRQELHKAQRELRALAADKREDGARKLKEEARQDAHKQLVDKLRGEIDDTKRLLRMKADMEGDLSSRLEQQARDALAQESLIHKLRSQLDRFKADSKLVDLDRTRPRLLSGGLNNFVEMCSSPDLVFRRKLAVSSQLSKTESQEALAKPVPSSITSSAAAAGLGESVPAQMEQMSPSTVANAQGASAHKKQATQAAAAPAPRPAAFKQHQNPATAAAAKTALTLKALAHKSFAANFEVDAQLAARLAAEESHRIAPAGFTRMLAPQEVWAMQAAAQLRFGRPSQNLGLTQELLKQFVAGAFLPAARQPVLASHMGTTGTHRHEGRKQGHVLTPAQLHKSGLAGLLNHGNTCFASSVIQCLTAVPDVVAHFASLHRRGKQDPATGKPLTASFAGLLHTMRHARGQPVPTVRLMTEVVHVQSKFGDGQQHDSHEFLRCLSYALAADGNRVLQRPAYKDLEGKGSVAEQAEEAWTLTRRSSSSVIEDLFAGQLMSTLTCPDCGAQSHCFTEVLDLSLPLLRGRELNTIQELLDEFTKVEKLQEDEGFDCQHCKKKVLGTKKLSLYRCPPVLVLQLNRFAMTGMEEDLAASTKDKTPVVVAEQLDLSNYCSRAGTGAVGKKGAETQLAPEAAAQQQPNPLYSLVAISKHHGSMDGGHYTAQCKSALTEQWLDYNDDRVREAAAVSGASEHAYMLFYRCQA